MDDNMKYGVWILWVGSAAAIVLGGSFVGTAGKIVFGALLVAHLGEFVIKRSLFARAGGSMAHHFVQTLIYGFFHWKPIQDRLEGSRET